MSLQFTDGCGIDGSETSAQETELLDNSNRTIRALHAAQAQQRWGL